MTDQRTDAIGMPECHNADSVLLMADRYSRASNGMAEWAREAKTCVEFVEGKQWAAEALAKLDSESRPAFTFNKIAPLVRLVVGYHRNNRVDAKFLPGYDGSGTQDAAEALTHICKLISELNKEPYIDTEVFLDGIISGRGYYDSRMCFENNILGEIEIKAKDPFSIKLDPEGDTYDVNQHTFVIEDRWVSADEVEYTYGQQAGMLIAPMIRGGGYAGGIPSSINDLSQDIAPWRTFGGERGDIMESYLANVYDNTRKNVKLVDCQHYKRVMQRCVIDLETGAKEPIPDHWDKQKIDKVMHWAKQKYAAKQQANPLRVAVLPVRRVRWTTMVGDLIVFDAWSPYETYTITPFFPYFRRGKTRGMVEDLLDSQREINKRRSSQIDAVCRTAHSGWMTHKSGLSQEQKENIERNGASPGINIEWQGEAYQKPERIQAAAPPMAMERLESKASEDLREISGINESALGQNDNVQSGRAIEARQRQATISIQMYMDNMSRSKESLARKKLELIQNHYTEERVYRTQGDDGKNKIITINKRHTSGEIANDITSGRYSIAINETPLSASFASAQFDEMMQLAEKGILPMTHSVKSAIIDASSIPQKEVIKRELTESAQTQAPPDSSIEVAKIRSESQVEVAKIDSATKLTIHGISIEQAGIQAGQDQQVMQQPQQGIANDLSA